MLHLKARVARGSSSVSFPYTPASPFAPSFDIKLVDILGRPAGVESDLIGISLRIQGLITTKHQLKNLLPPASAPTVQRIITRMRAHNKNAAKAFEILARPPQFGYDDREKKFFFVLPPHCGVLEERPLAFALFGFAPASLKNLTLLSSWGFFNTEDKTVTIMADSNVGPHMNLDDCYELLETTQSFSDEDFVALRPGNFSFEFFFRPPPEKGKIAVQKKVKTLTSPDEALEILQPCLTELSEKAGLKSDALIVEKKKSGLAFFAATQNAYDLELHLAFNRTLTRLLNCPEEAIIDLNPKAGGSDPVEGGRRGEFLVGPIEPLHANKLASFYPLIIKAETVVGGRSYMAGHGTLTSLGFIDDLGEIYPMIVNTKDLQRGVIECQFFQRDLTQLTFEEDLELFAHFSIV